MANENSYDDDINRSIKGYLHANNINSSIDNDDDNHQQITTAATAPPIQKIISFTSRTQKHHRRRHHYNHQQHNLMTFITIIVVSLLLSSSPSAILCHAATTDCFDAIDNCDVWSADHACRHEIFKANEVCQKTCGLCLHLDYDAGEKQTISPNQEEATKTLRVIRQSYTFLRDLIKNNPKKDKLVCRNENDMCAFWASLGECENNPSYMHGSCALACKACLIESKEESKKFNNRLTEYQTAEASSTPGSTSQKSPYSWSQLLSSKKSIIANGNVYPRTPSERKTDCLLLFTHTTIIRHCPFSSDSDVNLYYKLDERFRGGFLAPGTDGKRLWLLTSPYRENPPMDFLVEVDTVDGRVVQQLIIPGSRDGHDAVRRDNSVFIANTRDGTIIELALPASAPPYTQSSISSGATRPSNTQLADVRNTHEGFTRADHINNIAIHDDVIFVSVHGGSAIRGASRKTVDGKMINPETRLSAVAKDGKGRELEFDEDGFVILENTGTWCHNIAFWKSDDDKDEDTEVVKLLTLDSKTGSLVSVIVKGAGFLTREVLWSPDETHPTLVPSRDIPSDFRGAGVFSKGLAVQDNTAFFAVTYARDPHLRRSVPFSLLVAVDIPTKTELFAKPIRANGIISQIMTQSYLGQQVKVPDINYVSTLAEVRRKCVEREDWTDGLHDCSYFTSIKKCREEGTRQQQGMGIARQKCCTCGGGDKSVEESFYVPPNVDISPEYHILARELGEPHGFENTYHINATITFPQSKDNGVEEMDDVKRCQEPPSGRSVRIPLEQKIGQKDVKDNNVALPICKLDISRLRQHVQSNNKAINGKDSTMMTNGSITTLPLISTVVKNDVVSAARHFKEYTNTLSSLIKDDILTPLGIDVSFIHEMHIVSLSPGVVSSSSPLRGSKTTSSSRHQIHIPLIAPNSFFLTMTIPFKDEDVVLRVRAMPGEAYEFNNIMRHDVIMNQGGDTDEEKAVYLVIDYGEETVTMEGNEDGESDDDMMSLLCGDGTQGGWVCEMMSGRTSTAVDEEDKGKEEEEGNERITTNAGSDMMSDVKSTAVDDNDGHDYGHDYGYDEEEMVTPKAGSDEL